MAQITFEYVISSVCKSDSSFNTIYQYIHGLAARGVHYIHRPGPILQDVGFFLLPVSVNKFYIFVANVTPNIPIAFWLML